MKPGAKPWVVAALVAVFLHYIYQGLKYLSAERFNLLLLVAGITTALAALPLIYHILRNK